MPLPHNAFVTTQADALADVVRQDIELDQILYCSLLREPMSDAEIEAMVQIAASFNRMDHITGMLLHADGVFVQLLEGPREAVNHLWARILRDPRHHGVVQLYHLLEVETRACENWSMRRVKFEEIRALIHEAKEEILAGKKNAWAPAIERMDFLLTNSNWDEFVKDFKRSA